MEKLQVGCVIAFENGVTQEQVEKLIAALRAKGVVEYATVNTFDPAYSGPVWYCP